MSQEMVWIIAVGAVALTGLAFVLGVLVGRNRARDKAQRERVALELAVKKSEEALDDFKRRASYHFGHTGDLFVELTDRYVALYRHLSEGASALAGDGHARFPVLELSPASERTPTPVDEEPQSSPESGPNQMREEAP